VKNWDMNKINLAIIGCGAIADVHAENVLSMSDRVNLSAVVDIDEEVAQRKALLWRVKDYYTDYREVLKRDDITAVDICLPHYLHKPVTIESAEAGKHILCEKPIANTLEEAEAMIEAARESGVKLMIAEVVCYNPLYHQIKELIERGYVGEIFMIRMTREHEMHQYLRERPWFLDKRKAGGGIMMAGGVHDIEVMRMLAGEITSVYSRQARKSLKEMEGDDTSAAIFEFENGAIGTLIESFSIKCPKTAFRLWVHGDLGTIAIINPGELTLYSDKIKEFKGEIKLEVEREPDPFYSEIEHFLDCVQYDREPKTNGEAVLKTLKVIISAYRSMETGERIIV